MRKFFTKTAALFLVTVMTLMSLAVMPFSVSAIKATENWLTTNVDGDTYTITSAEDLLAFKAALAAQEDFQGKTVKLTQDIDMTGANWICANDIFSGTFDGCGFSIKNLRGVATGNAQGLLFGSIKDATVQNLSMEGGVFYSKLAGGVITGMVSGFESCLLQNIYVDTEVESNTQDATAFIGRIEVHTTIRNCVVASNVIGNNCTTPGGFAGFVARLKPLSASTKVNFIDCAFTGSVVCKHAKGWAGPFVGLVEQGMLEYTDCFNMGTITIEQGLPSIVDTDVVSINTETFNFASFVAMNETWIQTGEKEMMPASVAQMLDKSYTPEGPVGPEYVTPGQKIYDYECMEEPAEVANSRIIFDGYISGASDTWDLSKTQAIADGTDVSLKMELPIPQSHISFDFEVERAGTYIFAIEYSTPHGEEYQHAMQFAVDDLEKEEIYLQYTDNYYWVVLTLELEAGDHTLTVYATENAFRALEGGKTIQSCNVRNFKFYQPISTDGLSVVDGAAVKLDSTTGVLRYTVRINKDLYDVLVKTYGKKNISFGTLFVSAENAAELGVVSKEVFNQEAYKYYDDNKPELLEDENGYYFYGYWTAENAEQYDDMMSVAGYIRFKANGVSKYIYTAYNAENDRSIAMVAARAAADTKPASENGYKVTVTVNGATVYSPYTVAEYESLKALAAYYKED